jgi:hypothetical protein
VLAAGTLGCSFIGALQEGQKIKAVTASYVAVEVPGLVGGGVLGGGSSVAAEAQGGMGLTLTLLVWGSPLAMMGGVLDCLDALSPTGS